MIQSYVLSRANFATTKNGKTLISPIPDGDQEPPQSRKRTPHLFLSSYRYASKKKRCIGDGEAEQFALLCALDGFGNEGSVLIHSFL